MKQAFLFIFFSLSLVAQNNRFVYEYTFVSDSTKATEVKKEIMFLDITSKGSEYYSEKNFVVDSTRRADFEKSRMGGLMNITIQGGNKVRLDFNKVTKEYPGYKTFVYISINRDNYKVTEDGELKWTILPDSEKIGDYTAQKAQVDFGGRKWTAWFTTEIPLQEGPYKFHGLPGLIVKIEDKTGTQKMQLVANKKLNPIKTNSNIPQRRNMRSDRNEINVTQAQFRKVWTDYKLDPAKNFRQMNSSGGVRYIGMTTVGGKQITDPNQIVRQMEQNIKEEIKAQNNRIEPDLYK